MTDEKNTRAVLRVSNIVPNYSSLGRHCDTCGHRFLSGVLIESASGRLTLCDSCGEKYLRHVRRISGLLIVDQARIRRART